MSNLKILGKANADNILYQLKHTGLNKRRIALRNDIIVNLLLVLNKTTNFPFTSHSKLKITCLMLKSSM
jgi:hypothetical protein